MKPGKTPGQRMRSGSSCCCSVAKLYPTLCNTMDCVAQQASLSFTISRSLLKLMSIASVMFSNHLILCYPLFLLPSIIIFKRYLSCQSCGKHKEELQTKTQQHWFLFYVITITEILCFFIRLWVLFQPEGLPLAFFLSFFLFLFLFLPLVFLKGQGYSQWAPSIALECLNFFFIFGG